MKSFKFSLDTVMDYKYHILEEKKREHGIIISDILKKEEAILALEREYNKHKDSFNSEKEKGMNILDATVYQSHIHNLLHNIKKECAKLDKLRTEEKAKSKEVREAKTEAASFEKLKEKRAAEYNSVIRKFEEQFVEDFIINKRLSQKLKI